MRLIDADALRIAIDKLEAESDMPKMWHNGIAFAVNRIVHAPTVDAVPVVRCKDCKHFIKSEEVCRLMSNNYEPQVEMTEDDFCSRGKRREE